MATSITFEQSDLGDFLQEIRTFFGDRWFDEYLKKESSLYKIENAHPVIQWWTKVKEMLDRTKHHDLNVTPMQETLQIIRLGSCLRAIKGVGVIDMNGYLLKTSVKDIFVSRFRSSAAFFSAFYETLVASAYIRKEYALSFISDETRRSPEFVLDVEGTKIFIECKRIEQRRIEKATGNKMRIITERVGRILLDNNYRVAVFILCPEETSTINVTRIIRNIRDMLTKGQIPAYSELEGFRFRITKLPPSQVVWARKGHQQEMVMTWTRDVLEPWKQTELGHTDTPIEVSYPHFRFVDRERALWEMDAYVGVAFEEFSNIIGGVGKIIRKASRQLPSNSVGLVYIECPPYNASPEEIDTFSKNVSNRLNNTTRINNLVLTGTMIGLDSIQHISNVFENKKSACSLPNGFQVVPLDERYKYSV